MKSSPPRLQPFENDTNVHRPLHGHCSNNPQALEHVDHHPDCTGSAEYCGGFGSYCTIQEIVRQNQAYPAAIWMAWDLFNASRKTQSSGWLFPACQVRVVRFYVSLLVLRLFLHLLFLLVVLLLRPCEFSVACRASTAILWVQCGVPNLNRNRVRSVWRAGPQPQSCEVSVACRTSTAIVWVQCGVPDLNRDHGRPMVRAGAQPRSWEASVACRTSTAIMRIQCCVYLTHVRKNVTRYVRRKVRKNVWRYVRKNVRRYVRKNVKRYVRKNVWRYVRTNCRKNVRKRMLERMSNDMSEDMPDRMSKDMSERMSERMSNDISEDMSDRMSETM